MKKPDKPNRTRSGAPAPERAEVLGLIPWKCESCGYELEAGPLGDIVAMQKHADKCNGTLIRVPVEPVEEYPERVPPKPKPEDA